MGDRIKLLEGYFNQDEFFDRITGSNCHAAKSESERFIETHLVCEDYQIELGTSKDDEFVPVFENPVRADRSRPKPGSKIFSSPELYLEGIQNDESLGKPLPFVVRAAKKLKILKPDRIAELCSEKLPKGGTLDDWKTLAKCKRDAYTKPADYFVWQPLPENPKQVYFKKDKREPTNPRYVVEASSVQINPAAYKMLNIAPKRADIEPLEVTIIKAEEPTSEPDNYPLAPVVPPAVIIKRLRDLQAQKRGALIGKFADEPESAIRDIKEDQRKKEFFSVESSAQQYLAYLRLSLKQYPEDAPKAIVQLTDLLLENQGPNKTFDPATIAAAGKVLGDHFKDPKALKPMVFYIMEQSKAKNWKWAWRHRLDIYIPLINNLLLSTRGADKIPSIDHLAKLEKALPDLRAAVLVAAAHRGVRTPEARNFLMGICENLSKSTNPKDLMVVAYAAPIAFQQDAASFLVQLINKTSTQMDTKGGIDDATGLPGTTLKDPLEEVHMASYQALRAVMKPWVASERSQVIRAAKIKETLDAFKKGLNDPSPRIQLFCAMVLIEEGYPDIAPILYKRLNDHIKDPMYSDRQSVALKILNDTINLDGYYEEGNLREFARKENMMKMPVEFNIPNMKEKVSITWKSLTLFAIAKFGEPREALSLLSKLLDEEKNEVDLLLTAQALNALAGPRAVPLLFARLRKPAPNSLFEYAISSAKAHKSTKAAPLVYQFLIHKNERIRRVALSTLKSFDSETVLQALIRDSKKDDSKVRLLMAEYLGTYQDVRAAERLLELAKDPAEDVQKQAVLSLSYIKDEKAKQLIADAAKKDPELKTRLEPILAG